MKSLQNSSSTENLLYNALGQMMETSGGAAGTVLYMYDESGHLIGEYTSAGGLIEETVWLGDIPVATLRPSGSGVTVYNIEADHLNTPRQITQATTANTQMWTWFSDPFGTTAATGASGFTYNLRFPGQIYDPQAGLQQNYFREYDPAIGRYVESDPVGLRGGINTYAYSRASPVGNADPSGLQAVAEGPYPGLNTVICDGTGTMIPQLQPLTPLADKCVSDCLLVHENSHIDDLIRIGPIGVCRGRMPGGIVTFADIQQRFDSEKKAYAAELACLKAKLAMLTCGDECRQMVKDRVNQISPYVTQPPNFPPNFGGH
jgi:RHS repeat-associated protein